MVDRAALSEALRAAVTLREKAVVVCAGGGSAAAPSGSADLAADLGLLRALGARPLAVCGSAAEAAALSDALRTAGERPASLPGASVARDSAPGGLVTVDGLLLTQLAALAYVPVIAPPVASASGGASPEEVAPDLLAASVAVMVGAERLVFLEGSPGDATRALLSAMGRTFLEARGSLLLALLAPEPAPAHAAPAPGGAS